MWCLSCAVSSLRLLILASDLDLILFLITTVFFIFHISFQDHPYPFLPLKSFSLCSWHFAFLSLWCSYLFSLLTMSYSFSPSIFDTHKYLFILLTMSHCFPSSLFDTHTSSFCSPCLTAFPPLSLILIPLHSAHHVLLLSVLSLWYSYLFILLNMFYCFPSPLFDTHTSSFYSPCFTAFPPLSLILIPLYSTHHVLLLSLLSLHLHCFLPHYSHQCHTADTLLHFAFP